MASLEEWLSDYTNQKEIDSKHLLLDWEADRNNLLAQVISLRSALLIQTNLSERYHKLVVSLLEEMEKVHMR